MVRLLAKIVEFITVALFCLCELIEYMRESD